jgi:Tat protein secretion system quality control protein TatD with DNase activity
MNFIDTHCYLDVSEFNGKKITASAKQLGVQSIIVPAVCRANFESIIQFGKSCCLLVKQTNFLIWVRIQLCVVYSALR